MSIIIYRFLKNRTDCFEFDYVKVTEGNRSDHAIITGTVGEEEAPDEASRDGEPDAASRDESNATQMDENSQPTDGEDTVFGYNSSSLWITLSIS